ncbi:hypothetical protein GYA49_05305 [Candidatus Beckwithbacteria bacterium]|nr:hypothetical protein [Candidatus Beckwithbacteria bacterium]
MNFRIYLLIIIVIALTVRFVGLESLSPPLNRDEAAIGYNAYSLLQTGKDEHGQSWPLAFKSIGDYKMPGYIYASVIPIKVFGLNVFAVRFWSALAGVSLVLALYLLAKNLALYKDGKKNEAIALLAAFLLTINPWHIHFSRLGFEANLNLALFLWALWGFLQSFKKPWFLLLSSVLLVAMQFTYSSSFVFLPLFMAGLIILFWKKLLARPKIILIISVIILGLGSLLAFRSVLSVSQAKQGITIFSDPGVIDTFNHARFALAQKNPLLAKLWLNKPFYFGRMLFKNYVMTFSLGFLWQNKYNHPWHVIPGQSYFYILDLLFLPIGLLTLLFFLIKSKTNIKNILLVWLWLFLSPAASAITTDAPHATRSLYLIPVLIITIAIGFIKVVDFLNQKTKTKWLPYGLFLALYFSQSIYAGYQYIYLFPKKYAPELFAGIKPAITYISQKQDERLVYVQGLNSSIYLDILFYGKINPRLVQETAVWTKADTVGLANIEAIGQYRFVDGEIRSLEPYYSVVQGTDCQGLNLEKSFTDSRSEKIWSVCRS